MQLRRRHRTLPSIEYAMNGTDSTGRLPQGLAPAFIEGRPCHG